MPTWKELKRFLEHDGWILVRETDHYFYAKELPDGKKLRTRVSKGSGEIHHNMWQWILKHELETTQEYFNRVK